MLTENLPAGLFLGVARMLTTILRGGVETQTLEITELTLLLCRSWTAIFFKEKLSAFCRFKRHNKE